MSKKLLAGLAAISASAGSFAAVTAPDVSPVVTYIEGLAAPIGLIGAAYLIVSYSIKGWRLMRGV